MTQVIVNPIRSKVTLLKRFLAWYKTTRIEVVKKSSTTLTLSEWRGEPVLVGTGNRLWSNPDFQMAFDVLENEHPGWSVMNPNARPDQRIAQQAKAEGYTMALMNLKALRILKQHSEMPEPTYEREVELQNQ